MTWHAIEQMPPAAQQWRQRQLSETPCLHPSCEITASRLGSWTELGPGCRLHDSDFGDYSYAHEQVDICHASIGRFASIASHVRIGPTDHPMQRPCQHHCTYRRRLFGFAEEDDTDFFQLRSNRRITIGHDVWIGHGAVIMPERQIGNGAVIAAGAVVTRDVAAFSIVAGVPAKPIRRRFEAAQGEALQRLAWWDWDHETLRRRLPLLAGPVDDLLRDCAALEPAQGAVEGVSP